MAFDSSNEKHLLDDLIKLTPIGDIIELQTPPTTIHVEIFPDFPNDNNSTFEFKSKQRHEWQYGSITNDGKIIIPIVQKTVKYHNESVSVCGGPLYFNASMVPMGDHFLKEWILYNYSKSTRKHHTKTNCISF